MWRSDRRSGGPDRGRNGLRLRRRQEGLAVDLHRSAAAASEVAKGLGELNALAAQIGLAASADAKAAKEQVGEIDKLWEPIETTVKEKDSGLYDRLEGAFATLKKAVEAEDFPQAQGAATDVAEAVKAYQVKFPG